MHYQANGEGSTRGDSPPGEAFDPPGNVGVAIAAMALPSVDPDAIRRHLDWMFRGALLPDEQIEIRSLDKPVRSRRSGDLAKAAADAGELAAKGRNTYFCSGVVADDFEPANPGGAVRDEDIVRRVGFFFDFDTVRPDTNTPASDEEAEATIRDGTLVGEFLSSECDWPDPLRLASGNGLQLHYQIAFPNDDEHGDLIKKAHHAVPRIAKILLPGERGWKLDTGISNASRLMRLAGTVNVKSSPTVDRPNRLARLLSVPPDAMMLTPTHLRSLIDLADEMDPPLAVARKAPGGDGERNAPSANGSHRKPQPHSEGDELLPGDDFNQRASWERDVLVGWKLHSTVGDEKRWTRPGKDDGPSATTNHNGTDTLKVFTTSTSLSSEGTYTKFGAYTALHHGGDFEAAARSLAEQGYGRRAEKPKRARKAALRREDSEDAKAYVRPTVADSRTGLPQIITGSDDTGEGFKRWTPAALDAIAAANRAAPDPIVYQRGPRLVRVRKASKGGGESCGISIDPLGVDALRGVMDRSADWGNPYFTKKGEMKIRWGPPRKDIAVDAMSLSDYGDRFPILETVADSPRFLADGTLILDPGYHAVGQLYYSPPAELVGLEVPETPTDSEVAAARSMILDDLLCDFTFANHASKANAVALMLLPFVRLMINGSCPLHHAEASTEGTGKGLLVQTCLLPSCGDDIASTPPKEDDAEWRKILTTHFMGGSPYLFLDNVANFYDRFTGDTLPVDSPSLAQALTTKVYKDRKLRASESVDVAVKTVFVSTGNNTIWSRELNRRLVLMQLVPTCEDPSSRTNFRHPDLLIWANLHRRELVRACLVLIRRWINMGRPQGRQVFGSFDAYAKTMGGILDAIGVEGFLGNRRVGGKDREATRWGLMTAKWHDTHSTRPVLAKDLVAVIESYSPLSEAMSDILQEGSERSRSMRLGHALKRNLNRVYGEWRIVAAGNDRHKCVGMYKLQNPSVPIETDSQEIGDEELMPVEKAEEWVPY
jgi:hypothetical protein